MLPMDNILVYHWHAWKGFLISHLIADYCQVEATYENKYDHLDKYLTPNIRAVLLQINLSRPALFPQERKELITHLHNKGIFVFNSNIGDITKRNLYRLLNSAGLTCTHAAEEGPKNQLLFVKSNLNCGGISERRLPDNLQLEFIPESQIKLGEGDDYVLLKRKDIPLSYWSDPGIVIENYVYNDENSFFRVYGFGEAIAIVKAHSNALIKKISGHTNDINILLNKDQIIARKTDIPKQLQETIRAFITHHAIEYFCLDIIHDTQQYYIIDLNLTPYAGVDKQNTEVLEFLRAGAQQHIKKLLHKELMSS